MRLAPKYVWSIVIVVTTMVIGYISIYRPSTNFTKDYTLPHDNFEKATMQQIEADIQQYQVAQNPQDHEVYMVTGGIGVANPRIMEWDSGGNMDFGFNGPPGIIYNIQEFGQNPMTWKQVITHGKLNPKSKKGVTFTYKPVHWIKHVTKTDQVFYNLDESPHASEYFFQKGSTYIVIRPFPNDAFPEGLMSHLVPIGNPVKK